MIRIALALVLMTTQAPALAESDRTIPDFRLVGDRWEIAADWGGWVASYKRAFESMEGTGLEVRVKDVCASACTMVLHNPRACAERAAMFGFHEAWVESEDGQARAHRATNRVWSQYPEHVRAKLGQLTPQMVWIKGTELLPECK
jgi:hypothetical protein